MWEKLYIVKSNFEPDYIGYNAGLAKNKLNFGYGVNFKFNGKVHNNLDRVWIVKRFNLPQELNLQFKGVEFCIELYLWQFNKKCQT